MVDTESIDMELLLRPFKDGEYSDHNAYVMAKMSDWAYKDKPDIIDYLKVCGFELIEFFDNGETQAYLATRELDHIAVLAFRGTAIGTSVRNLNLADVLTDIRANFTHVDKYKIHTGFYEAFQNIKNDIKIKIKVLTDYKLYITGHSLGAALALIATQNFNSENINVVACYTFGCPRVGNKKFGKNIKTPVYRIVNENDIVTIVPMVFLEYFISAVLSVIFFVLLSPLILILGVLSLLSLGWNLLSGGYKHYGKTQYFDSTGARQSIKNGMVFHAKHALFVIWLSLWALVWYSALFPVLSPIWSFMQSLYRSIKEKFSHKHKERGIADKIESIQQHSISAYCEKLRKLTSIQLHEECNKVIQLKED